MFLLNTRHQSIRKDGSLTLAWTLTTILKVLLLHLYNDLIYPICHLHPFRSMKLKTMIGEEEIDQRLPRLKIGEGIVDDRIAKKGLAMSK